MAVSRAGKRLQRELADLTSCATFPVELVGEITDKWIVTIRGAEGTLYSGEIFRLQFTFGAEYPIESPEVVFLSPAPKHPHIYSNGHICLSILYDAWSPALKVETVCMSIQSMLSSAREKSHPKDNDSYIMRCAKSPKQTRWDFHDADA
jgi:ubiquitin-conjugating enzyme E2 W